MNYGGIGVRQRGRITTASEDRPVAAVALIRREEGDRRELVHSEAGDGRASLVCGQCREVW